MADRHNAQYVRKQLVRLKRSWRRATLRRQAFIIIGALLVCMTVSGLILIKVGSKNPQPSPNAGVRSQPSSTVLPESSARFVPSGKSTLCDALTLKKIREASKQSFVSMSAGLPDAKTKDGMVSGCVYRAADDASQSIHAVNVFVRTINDGQAAEKEYQRLTQRGGKEVSEQGIKLYYLSDSNQAIMRQGNRIITLILVKFKADSKVSQTDFVNIMLAVVSIYK